MHAHFDIPPGGPYLLAHSVGCMPRGAAGVLERVLFEPWRSEGGDAWGLWLETIDGFRGRLARLFGGAAEQWCPQPSIAAAVTAVLSGLPFETGRRTLLASAEAFPSVGYALQGLERIGLRLELLDGDPRDLASWARIGDPDVAAVLITHVHSNSGRISPVGELTRLARAHGVVSIVDIAQSAGIVPLSVAGWQADAVAGTALKWLSGGPGTAFLWAAPDLLQRAEPMERGWFSHADPFEMDIRRFAFAPDARRFWGGTPSIAPYALASAGLDLIADIGVETIRAHNLALQARLAGRLGGAIPLPDPDRHGGTLCLALGPSAEQALRTIGARFDRRGPVLRMSLGAWNTAAEIDALADALLKAGAS